MRQLGPSNFEIAQLVIGQASGTDNAQVVLADVFAEFLRVLDAMLFADQVLARVLVKVVDTLGVVGVGDALAEVAEAVEDGLVLNLLLLHLLLLRLNLASMPQLLLRIINCDRELIIHKIFEVVDINFLREQRPLLLLLLYPKFFF